jgi:hypothetical protein
MEAKEKAKLLINRFTHNGTVNWSAAKKDALICVDELMLDNHSNDNYFYWRKIKEEINKL